MLHRFLFNAAWAVAALLALPAVGVETPDLFGSHTARLSAIQLAPSRQAASGFAASGFASSRLAPSPLQAGFVDLDRYVEVSQAEQLALPVGPVAGCVMTSGDCWGWQVLPDSLLYPMYLAGTKESRFSAHVMDVAQDDSMFDATLGTHVGLVRYGSCSSFYPEGFQIDAEGSAQLRLDLPEDVDVQSVDFRAGMPFTFARGRYRTRFGYYHLSSHLADEFIAKNPTFPRVNYSRDVLFLGQTIFLTERLRIYGEMGWAFRCDVSEPWEFQFGIDYAPVFSTGFRGAPFAAVNVHFREEVNFGGGFTAQAGWAWIGDVSPHMLRMGIHYYNGESNQFSFYDQHEQQLGFGTWYDF